MLAQPFRGRAWRGSPKPRRRSWLRKQSAQALQTAIKTRVVSTGRRGGPSWTTSASGETLERRLWAIQGDDRRACPAHKMGVHLIARWLSTAEDWGDRRSLASNYSCLRRCDLCEPVFALPAPQRPPARRIERYADTALDSERATPRSAVAPHATADAACRLARGRARSGSAARRRKKCS